MPSSSTDTRSSLWDRATAQRNVVIYVAILVAVPTAYGFHTLVDAAAGDFLLLMTLATGVPMTYNNYWPAYDRTWKAVGWVLVTCTLATGVFTGLYLAGTDLLAVAPFPASAGAFAVTFLGVHGIGYLWHGR
ncbi:hypothetical protein BV210_03835 [Halorientalis sp. IM1011]|uniref:hypothetical protein n=1 Tax=Halorientalis sp. IM1011 TaxID=1932360 RepID=UPI00097CD6AA|nr:hypothetical protein [Halorientalis sp. IM1011]AQL41897.1 hypothetical protein BV210_03835 [Halorientalis sp. IM1011]